MLDLWKNYLKKFANDKIIGKVKIIAIIQVNIEMQLIELVI